MGVAILIISRAGLIYYIYNGKALTSLFDGTTESLSNIPSLRNYFQHNATDGRICHEPINGVH